MGINIYACVSVHLFSYENVTLLMVSQLIKRTFWFSKTQLYTHVYIFIHTAREDHLEIYIRELKVVFLGYESWHFFLFIIKPKITLSILGYQ